MPPELPGIAKAELDRLFPFHIAFSAGSRPRIAGIGEALEKLIESTWQNTPFADLFEIARPRNTAVDLALLCESGKTVVLRHKRSPLSLLGLLVPLEHTGYLFACRLEVTSSSTLEVLGLNLNDFAPADPTPDIIILHRFRELQQADGQRQIEELRKTVAARDKFDRHASTDALTGIGNRRSFWREGSTFLEQIGDEKTAVILLMDLDGFKKVNDTYGHDAGDEVLQTVARRCQQRVGNHGLVARLGGDEFVALVGLDSRGVVDVFIDGLMASLTAPMSCQNRQIHIRPSMGVATLARTQTIDLAIHYADLAMYEGRRRSDASISWFTADMQDREDHRMSILADIAEAIGSREFIPYFQPIVDLRGQCVHGFEALARWQHPVHGLMFPDAFIELAAEAGCLHELDYCILECALDQLLQWDRASQQFTIHVNLSGSSVRAGLDEMTMRLLTERNIRSSRLTLELTETTLLEFSQEEIAVLNRLADHGVIIQLDDFGTGYSSLRHLHDFPVKGVKVDRSFLFGFPDDSRRLALIESVIKIASHLDMTVVTEGIETQEQLDWIGSIGCRYGQGYLFGKPAPANEWDGALTEWPMLVGKAA